MSKFPEYPSEYKATPPTAQEQFRQDGILRAASSPSSTAQERPEPILQFFEYRHLPPHLQVVSSPFKALAQQILELPRNPERTVALRKLLESKDAAVRAVIYKEG